MSSEGFQLPENTALPIYHRPAVGDGIAHRYDFGDNEARLILETHHPGEIYLKFIRVEAVEDDNYQRRGLGTYAFAFACAIAEQSGRNTVRAQVVSPFMLKIMRNLVGDDNLQCSRRYAAADPSDTPPSIAVQDAEDVLAATYRGPAYLSSAYINVIFDLSTISDERRSAIRTIVREGLPKWKTGGTITPSAAILSGGSVESTAGGIKQQIATALGRLTTATGHITDGIAAAETMRGQLATAFEGSSNPQAEAAQTALQEALSLLDEAQVLTHTSSHSAEIYAEEI